MIVNYQRPQVQLPQTKNMKFKKQEKNFFLISFTVMQH